MYPPPPSKALENLLDSSFADLCRQNDSNAHPCCVGGTAWMCHFIIEQVVVVRVRKIEMYIEISSAVSQKHVEQHLLSALTVMQDLTRHISRQSLWLSRNTIWHHTFPPENIRFNYFIISLCEILFNTLPQNLFFGSVQWAHSDTRTHARTNIFFHLFSLFLFSFFHSCDPHPSIHSSIHPSIHPFILLRRSRSKRCRYCHLSL